ncbi:hypothetical protein GCM10010307_04990 [Streptomyces vastus]|uniref:Uncharacterized protein n=1 Tax=Streptomyces vastus TaxID=285451 RepID=A0ABP6CPW8_9ACTN
MAQQPPVAPPVRPGTVKIGAARGRFGPRAAPFSSQALRMLPQPYCPAPVAGPARRDPYGEREPPVRATVTHPMHACDAKGPVRSPHGPLGRLLSYSEIWTSVTLAATLVALLLVVSETSE